MRPLRAAAVLLLVGCTPPPPRAQPEPTLQVPAIASATTRSPSSPPSRAPVLPDIPNLYSWQHPEVIERLAADCRWRPSDSSPEARSQLSCRLPSSDQAYPDPCLDEYENTCKPACGKACDGCARTCVTACETCKSACTTDACNTTCAEQCAGCRDVCVQGIERCQASTCGDAYQSCQLLLADEMKKPACKASCQRATQCVSKCSGESESCFEACSKRFASSCSEQLFRLCTASARGM